MELLIFAAGATLAVVAAVRWATQRDETVVTSVEIDLCGVELGLARPDAGEPCLRGLRGGVPVRVEFDTRATRLGKAWTRVFLEGLPGDLEVRRRVGNEPSQHTGDPDFDPEVYVSGPETVGVALDAPTRAALLALVRDRGGWVGQGRLYVELEGLLSVAPLLGPALDALVDLSLRLQPPAYSARLVERAARDPSPGMRRRCLADLERLHAAPFAAAAATAARADPDPLVRLQGALILGDGEALCEGDPEQVRALALLEPEAVTRALARGRREDRLIAMLDASPDVCVAACDALAGMGTALAVEPLYAYTLGAPDSTPATALAATRAVAGIQARIGDGSAGQVSLAADGGELSLAAQAGAVAIAKR